MNPPDTLPRRFLFLQGPPGPFFHHLAQTLADQGASVRRINLHGGDEHDWPTPIDHTAAICFRARAAHWPAFIDHTLRAEQITDLVLFGDCRPLHIVAHHKARQAGIRVHVFEEGYIRPNWLTLERGGVNGHSPLPRDPQAILSAAQGLPPPPDLPPIGASLGRRVRDTWRYFRGMVWGALRLRYPFYRSHRPGSIMLEGLGWLATKASSASTEVRARQTLAHLQGETYFLFPLQLSSDYQIRVHSPFPTMRQAADHVLASFAAHAPPGVKLVIKEHPLDFASWGRWRPYVARRARALGLGDRLVHLAGGDLATLALAARGMVVVNSTSATFALAGGIPVKALGTAVYAIPGITDQQSLDTFWASPTPPDATLYDAFCRLLHHRCLVRGGLASQSAIRILIDNAAPRLLAD